MLPITICVMIASGYERIGTPATQAERLDFLLSSLITYEVAGVPVIVSDDFSTNTPAQNECRKVCKKYNVTYVLKPAPWTGPSGNANHVVNLCSTEFIALLGDDQYCTPGWWEYMMHFIKSNLTLGWGMLGWSVVFANRIVKEGLLRSKGEFYTHKEVIKNLTVNNIPREWFEGHQNGWESPYPCVWSAGSAFVLRKSLWYKFGGFHEQLYQFDEDYGSNVWYFGSGCFQIPTPPILHYSGGCSWPPYKTNLDKRWAEGWETKPHHPCKFEGRLNLPQEAVSSYPRYIVASLDYKRLPPSFGTTIKLDFKGVVHPNDTLGFCGSLNNKPEVVRWDEVQAHYAWYEMFGRWFNPTSFLEIGVAAGYSTYAILLGCNGHTPNVITWVDNGDGKGWVMMHEYALGLVRGKFGILPEIISTSSHNITTLKHKYDLIHVDGDHTYEGVLQDMNLALDHLTDGGHIIFHDTNDHNITNAINDFVRMKGELEVVDIPEVRCGVRIMHRLPHAICCPLDHNLEQIRRVRHE